MFLTREVSSVGYDTLTPSPRAPPFLDCGCARLATQLTWAYPHVEATLPSTSSCFYGDAGAVPCCLCDEGLSKVETSSGRSDTLDHLIGLLSRSVITTVCGILILCRNIMMTAIQWQPVGGLESRKNRIGRSSQPHTTPCSMVSAVPVKHCQVTVKPTVSVSHWCLALVRYMSSSVLTRTYNCSTALRKHVLGGKYIETPPRWVPPCSSPPPDFDVVPTGAAIERITLSVVLFSSR